ncbi:acyltransferase [Rhizobium sp. WYJ-E13]|uniref:acyltransferase n=1 Tax=Rhizobium sp. WYJ-E13 TaxID=2849093 RepID=UPI001C1EBB57|nr:acyltransferase family protein [Rhizobium sp. WYJ-E13]QWW70111.1 acyltransferase family protein [Rhizobium sp. WYJ-E13]
MSRDTNIDALRLIAAVGVVSLHVGTFPELPRLAVDVLQSFLRWCVPVFLMITGYLLADRGRRFPDITVPRIARIASLYGLAFAIYLPIYLYRNGVGDADLGLILRGPAGHMWYLSALLVAFVVIPAFRQIDAYRPLVAFSAFVLIGYIGINYMFSLKHRGFDILLIFRTFIGVPCIMAGVWLRRHGESRFYTLLLLVSAALCIAEIFVIKGLGGAARDAQFLFSTLFMAAGILGATISMKQVLPARLAEMGRDDSLGIYIYHPIFILLFTFVITKVAGLSPPGTLIWIGATVLTVCFLFGSRTISPHLRRIEDGDFRAASPVD